MPVEMDVQTTGYSRTQAVIDRAYRAQADLRPGFRAIIAQFEDEQARVFEASGGYGGRPRWQSLSDAYAAWKARHHPGKSILELTGGLWASLVDSENPGAVRIVERDRAVIGSTRKANAYNLGWLHAIGAGNLPRREAIRPTAAQDEAWADLMMKHLFVED